jgi:hypothetical protein
VQAANATPATSIIKNDFFIIYYYIILWSENNLKDQKIQDIGGQHHPKQRLPGTLQPPAAGRTLFRLFPESAASQIGILYHIPGVKKLLIFVRSKFLTMKQISTFLRGAAICLIALFISSALQAQCADLSGTWKLNASKSKLNEQFSMAPKRLVITQDAAILTVERHSEFMDQQFVTKDKFTLDGKECENEGFQGSKKKSTATWSDDKQVLTVKSTIPMEGAGEISFKEVFSLAEGSLSVETTTSSDWGSSSESYIFDK